ncbi:MAG: acyl-CoA carboxylase subunit beta [Myxococcales bacterium]|nr:acyl-CoA carboxylase subunit beta [Myxococcales bacterium]
MSIEERIKRLEELSATAEQGGGAARIERQHQSGRLTARERIELLLDPGSFAEIDKFVVHRCNDFGMEQNRIPGDGVVTGSGRIDGRTVFLFAQDFTVFGGSLSATFAEKICKVMDLAAKVGAPFIGLNDGAGARIQEGVASLAGYGSVFYRNVMSSAVVPQISAIMGPCAGGAVYSPAMTDFIIMVKSTSNMFITGPDVVKTVTHEEVTAEDLGGATTHASKSGVCAFAAGSEQEAISLTRRLLSYLPANNLEDPPFVPTEDDPHRMESALHALVPENPNKPYDIRELVKLVVDDGDFLEVHAQWARNLVIGFARFGGQSVGIVANQPAHLAGCLDIDSSRKGARFVRFCDAFNIPLVTFVDVPGFLPGTDQEYDGIITHGSKLLYAFCEATVPRISIATRKAYGGAYVVMNSRSVGADLYFAYPTSEFAVMGPDGAVNIVFRKELAESKDHEARKEELVEEYREKFANPFKAAELGLVDEVIKPEETRPKIIQALTMLKNKRAENPPKKHGNIPL